MSHFTDIDGEKRFTPAPWSYAIDGDSCIYKDGRVLCKMPPKGECTPDQWGRNAHLIKEAPALYDFIEQTLDRLPPHFQDDALRLLAKARGWRGDA